MANDPWLYFSLLHGFRTTHPRTVIALGCQRAALVSAKNDRGQLPILNPPGDDGLTAFVDATGRVGSRTHVVHLLHDLLLTKPKEGR